MRTYGAKLQHAFLTFSYGIFLQNVKIGLKNKRVCRVGPSLTIYRQLDHNLIGPNLGLIEASSIHSFSRRYT